MVRGETCQFPPDHPIQNLTAGQTVLVQTVMQYRRYIYDRTFGGCSGCVRNLTFCYRHGGAVLNAMTVEIRNPGNGNNKTFDVTVNADNLHNCAENYGLGSPNCCVNQTLAEPFRVQSDKHYALNIGHTSSLLLRHQDDTVPGMQERTHPSSSPLPGSVYKPLFYFTIDTTNGRLYIYIVIWYNAPTSLSGPCMATTTPDTDDPTEGSNEGSTEGPAEGPTEGSETTSPTNDDDPTSAPSTTSSSPSSTTPSSPADSTTASTDPEVAVGAQGGGGESDSSGSGPVAGGIAALLAIIILLIIGAVVGIMYLKKKQRQRKVLVSRSGEESAGITNVVYGGMFYVR